MTTPTKVLDLRGLSATERDVRVNKAVAVVAGYRVESKDPNNYDGEVYPYRLRRPDGQAVGAWWKKEEDAWNHGVPPYATSCDAVIPLLGKCSDVEINRVEGDGWQVSIMDVRREDGVTTTSVLAEGWEDTFPLAACYALLRANGWDVLT